MTPHSSPDLSLSAFAQLGALRLDAQRVTISLFGRYEEHILTEVTKTLSLRDDNDHETQDELWVGACTMSYDRSFGAAIANSTSPSTKAPASPVITIPDLTQSNIYKEHPDVTSYPNVRFLASAPIVSPKGIVIGAYTILDDRPRDSLGRGHLKFLKDMAATVMDYLVTNRSRSQHFRSERMIVGLGSFLEGKGSLRSSWVDGTDKGEGFDQDDDVEGRVNTQQQHKQHLDGMAHSKAQKDRQSDLPFRLDRSHTSPGLRAKDSRERPNSLPRSKTKSPRPVWDDPKFHSPSETISSRKRAVGKSQSNKEASMIQIEETFARAANIVRESLEIEGVVFFDANFSGQAALVTTNNSDYESSLEGSASEGELKAKNGHIRLDILDSMAEDTGKATVNPCKILGFATSDAASVNNESTGDRNIALSESYLAGLLRRYPRGKIFNFDADGSISSDDTSDSIFKNFSSRMGKKYKRTRKSVLRQDALTLLNIAPGSRSIIFSPVWDSHKSKWSAGSFAWTKTPKRVFTFDDEMTFCTALGSSLIAEVHRLGAMFAEQAKSDLLAGLSHELRSPLHGIFGTAELLSDTAIDALQRGFVHTITSCANTLLGSINQLLEFSGINDINQNRDLTPSPSSHGEGSPQIDQPDAESSVQVDATVEDTIETVFSGFCFFHNSRLPLRSGPDTNSRPSGIVSLPGRVNIILDIDKVSNWTFITRLGALHVILTNIVGNALKYTQEGHIYVQVKTKTIAFDEDDTPIRSRITISVQDTGCGMDPEFLRNGYFAPFSQEDDMLPGNGLGASITQKTVASLQGEIEVLSQKQIGTHVKIALPLDHVAKNTASGESLDDNPQADDLAPIKRLVRQKSIGILGFGTSEMDKLTSSSLEKICREWLQMNVISVTPSHSNFPHCDFYIALHQYLDIGNLEIKAIAPGPEAQLSSPVIIICSSPRVAHSLHLAAQQRGDSEVLEFISQPCGPRKLAKSLEVCIQRQTERISRNKASESSTASALDKLKRQTPPTPNAGLPGHPELKPTRSSKALRKEYAASAEQCKPPLTDEDYFSIVAPALAPSPEVGRSPANERTPQPLSSTPRTPFTVLLVDDNDINISLLVAYMKKLGLDYIVAQNGQEALVSFKACFSRIRIILMGKAQPFGPKR